MEHNLFKFTLRARCEPGSDLPPQIEDYVSYITRSLDHEQAVLNDIVSIPVTDTDDLALSYIKLLVRDYGVGQIGVDIVNLWMYRLFIGCLTSSMKVKVEAIVVHPLELVATGALIIWDWETNQPIIQDLEL